VWVSHISGVHWTNEGMSQTGGPGFSCSHPNVFDTNCQIGSFPAGATATFTASAVADPSSATIGEILNARFFVSLGASPSGAVYTGTVVSLPVVAATPATTTTATTTAPPPPPPTTTTGSTTTTTTTTITTTATPTTTVPAPTPEPVCRVPLLTGLTVSAARHAVAARHCKLAVVYVLSRTVPKGKIVRESPARGTRMTPGATVHVAVSRGRR
jgi:hypothetical protein